MLSAPISSHFANHEAFWLRAASAPDGDGVRPTSPVYLSVPHAGRDYPNYILRNSRLPQNALLKLEDRYADLLVTQALKQGYDAIIARAPRAWIDLNREPIDLDFQYITQMPWAERKACLAAQRTMPDNMKSNAGLGLIPSRLSGYGEIWRSAWPWSDVQQRIAMTHGAYHDALSAQLMARHNRDGCAILLDVHSMPSLPKTRGAQNTSPQIVLGNRNGNSADAALMNALERIARAYGLHVGHNQPYAGGYVLNRHADRPNNIQAIQIEFDRALYLDSHGDPANGINQMQSLLLDMANLAHDYASTYLKVQAAE
jgi:N-formylglutamate amidohydrolase